MSDIYASVAIIKYNNQLILVERSHKDGSITFETPGGHVEPGETSEDAVIREVKEEAEIDVKITRFIKEFESNGRKIHYFECEVINSSQLENNPLIFLTDINEEPTLKITTFAKERLLQLGFLAG